VQIWTTRLEYLSSGSQFSNILERVTNFPQRMQAHTAENQHTPRLLQVCSAWVQQEVLMSKIGMDAFGYIWAELQADALGGVCEQDV